MTNTNLQSQHRQLFFINSIRCGLYLLVVLLALILHIMQASFYNWDLLKSFYLISALGLGLHLPSLIMNRPWVRSLWWLGAGLILDVLLTSALLHFSVLNQALFLFLYLVIIIIAGLLFKRRGAFAIAALVSICFSVVSLLGPEIKAMSFVFLLLINNLAFFVVASLASYLSDQFRIFETELTAKTLSLAQFRALNEMMVEVLPVGLLGLTSKGEILRANPSAHVIFGSEDLRGKSIDQILPGFLSISENVLASGKGSQIEIKYARGEEEVLLGLKHLRPAMEQEQIESQFLVVEDLTEVRKMETVVRQTEKMAAVGQLAAGIAHEIRNPLAGISGSIELLSQTSANDDDKKLIKIILREIDRLNNLISEFLDFAKPERAFVDRVNVRDVVNSVSHHLISQFPKVKFEVVGELSQPVRGNSDKLKQALLNIFINSAQAMDSVPDPHLQVFLKTDEAAHHLWIRDNGSGMKPETVKRMFEPFHTTKPKGTGLGLAVTHKILDAHQARIHVQSELGKGTEFQIELPLSLS
jgi:two-component system sensor histidine kinase PilS (NtrC family)